MKKLSLSVLLLIGGVVYYSVGAPPLLTFGNDLGLHTTLFSALFAMLLLTLFSIYQTLSRYITSDIHKLSFGNGDFAYRVLVSFTITLILSAAVIGLILQQDKQHGAMLIFILMAFFTLPSTLFTLYFGKKANDSLRESRYEVIRRLGHAAEFKDNETALHIIRMSFYTKILANKLKMSKEWQELIFTAAPMHDIGKIGVPDAILNKKGKLTAEEWVIMRKHPQFGADIIGHHNSTLLKMARDIAIAHHEKWDGTGYPNQLSGNDIPLAARVVAIADVFDALTSERHYKKAWAFEEAVAYIVAESGQHFDPDIVRAFTKSIPEFKVIHHRYSDKIDH